MSLTASARSVPGAFRQDVLIDGRHELVTDEPVRLGGDDLGPAPHELLPAALAACISTTLVTYARSKEWDVGQVAVDVVYDHKAVPRRFDVAISVDGPVDDIQLARLRRVAEACPLRRALETGFEFHEDFRHPGPKAAGGRRHGSRHGRLSQGPRRHHGAGRRTAYAGKEPAQTHTGGA